MSKKTNQVYQFKVSLRGSKPSIWRRIIVPSTYTFFDLHVAIQSAMGWMDFHLHAFEFRLPNRGTIEISSEPADELHSFRYNQRNFSEDKAKISVHFDQLSKSCIYTYDFGDSWDHIVKLEKILPIVEGETYPTCTAGKMACPPEDCGGLYGYYMYMDALQDPKSEEYETAVEVLGEDFDAESFFPESVIFSDPKLAKKNRDFFM